MLAALTLQLTSSGDAAASLEQLSQSHSQLQSQVLAYQSRQTELQLHLETQVALVESVQLELASAETERESQARDFLALQGRAEAADHEVAGTQTQLTELQVRP